MTEVLPTSLALADNGQLVIGWSDGITTQYRPQLLRDLCPCATCREKRRAAEEAPPKPTMLTVLSMAETLPLRVLKMRPVGNYAYNIQFSDGHDSGIFSFDFLRNAAGGKASTEPNENR